MEKLIFLIILLLVIVVIYLVSFNLKVIEDDSTKYLIIEYKKPMEKYFSNYLVIKQWKK